MMIKSIKTFTGTSLQRQSSFAEWLKEYVEGQGVITTVNFDEAANKMYLYIGDDLAIETGDAGFGLRLYSKLSSTTPLFSLSQSASQANAMKNLYTAFATDNGFGFTMWISSTSALTYQAAAFVVVSTFSDGSPFILYKSSNNISLIEFNHSQATRTAMATAQSLNSTSSIGTNNPYNVAFMPVSSMLQAMSSDTVMLHPITWSTDDIDVQVITDSSGNDWVNLLGLVSLKA